MTATTTKSDTYTSRDIYKTFEIHPRKRVASVPAGLPTTLREVYSSWSYAKESAYKDCCDLCDRMRGRNFGISAHNTMTFTVTFEFPNPETGELMRAVITRDHNHAYYVG